MSAVVVKSKNPNWSRIAGIWRQRIYLSTGQWLLSRTNKQVFALFRSLCIVRPNPVVEQWLAKFLFDLFVSTLGYGAIHTLKRGVSDSFRTRYRSICLFNNLLG